MINEVLAEAGVYLFEHQPTSITHAVIFVQSFLTLIRTILTWYFGFAITSWLTLFSDGLIYHRTLAYEGEGRRVKQSWRMVLPQTFPTFNHYNYIVESKLLIDVSAMFARNPSSEIRQSGKSITVIQLKSKYFNRHLRLIWWQTFQINYGRTIEASKSNIRVVLILII